MTARPPAERCDFAPADLDCAWPAYRCRRCGTTYLFRTWTHARIAAWLAAPPLCRPPDRTPIAAATPGPPAADRAPLDDGPPARYSPEPCPIKGRPCPALRMNLAAYFCQYDLDGIDGPCGPTRRALAVLKLCNRLIAEEPCPYLPELSPTETIHRPPIAADAGADAAGGKNRENPREI